jgi:protein-S-isoprenylcysteine O-methyltransferase Ste14
MERKLFFVFVTVCIVTHIIRAIYEILKHKQILKPGKLSFVIILFNMILLWVTWVLLCRYDIYKIDLPGIIIYAGISLALVGMVVFLTGLFTIKTLESYEGDLITSGIYSVVRHPMYLAFIMWLIGFPLMFGAVFSMILSLLFICNILFWRLLEEKELLNRFPAYPDYKKKTFF